MTKTQTNTESRLLTIVSQFLRELEAERALNAINLDASLERDLGIDSLGKVELIHRIENEFSIHLPEKAITEVESLRDLIKLIERTESVSGAPKKTQPFSEILTESSLDLSTVKTLTDAILLHASKSGSRPHVYLQNEKGEEEIIRYGKLFEEAESVAKGLYQRGIQPGETVAIMLPTSDAFFYAFCGILLAGAVPVPIYPPYRPDKIEEYAKREAKILQNAQARILITFSRAEILSNMLKTFIPSLKEVTTLKNLQSKKGELPSISIVPTDPILIQYTSGSTGDPKGVLLTHLNFLANLRGIGKGIPVKPTDVSVSWLPLYHDMGLMNWVASLFFGIPLTIMSPLTFLTRPERWLWAIHYHRATLSGGPNFAYELCTKKIDKKDIEGLDLSSWQFAFNGAEGINPRTLERFYKRFSAYGFKYESFAPVYGLAESTVGLTFPEKKRAPRIDKIKRSSFELDNKAIPTEESDAIEFVACGAAMPEHGIRIVDDAGNELSERSVGNIQFKGPSAMQGYFNNPAATQKVYHNGWWDSGDLGYLADRDIFITGRKKDVIIKAGRNLYPVEVEEIVSQISSIRKGCVIAFGINDPKTGTEKLVVVAETYDLSQDSKQRIQAEIIEKMAIDLGIPPDSIILVPPHTVPKTSSGKLQRSACKQLYLDGKLTRHQLPAKLQIAKLALISASKKVYSWLGYIGKLSYLFYIAIILLITAPFVWLSLFIFSKKTAAKIVRFWSRNFFRLALCPVTIEGLDNLKNYNTMVFAANHASYADALLLLGILPPGIIFTAKNETLNYPVIKTFIKKLGYITVERTDFSKSLENKKQIEETLRQEQSIVIFPEGTFTYATGLRPFKLGAFTIAVDTEKPICPVAIQGTRSILRGDSFLAKPGAIKVTIGTPIIPKQKDWNEIIRIHSLVRGEIAKNCGEPVIDVIVSGPVLD